MRIDGKAASSEFDGGKLKIMRVVTLHTLFLGSLSTAEEILLQISWRWPDRSGTHSRSKWRGEMHTHMHPRDTSKMRTHTHP